MKKVIIYTHKCMKGKSINDMLFSPVQKKNGKWVYHYWLCDKVEHL